LTHIVNDMDMITKLEIKWYEPWKPDFDIVELIRVWSIWNESKKKYIIRFDMLYTEPLWCMQIRTHTASGLSTYWSIPLNTVKQTALQRLL
jgi:hypothetical protein